MLLEEFGPDGKRRGASGEAQYPLVVPASDGKWHLRTAKVRFVDGFLDALEIDGRPVATPKGSFGPSVTLHVCGNLSTDSLGRTGDVWRLRWDDGLLVENTLIIKGVQIV
jgi:hypothetical protein